MKRKLLIPNRPSPQSGNGVPKFLRLGLLVAAAISLAANVLAQSPTGLQTVDKVKSYAGALKGAMFSANGGGHTGKTGDYAMDMGTTGAGPVYVAGATWLNDAAANDELAVSLWVKKYDIVSSSAFWMNSPSSGGRGAQAHIPWGNDNIYFDTAGCCDESLQRLQQSITSFDDYTAVGDDTYWTNWHFFVFTKKADLKQIWIDGKLFLEGSNTRVLPTDFTDFYIGSAGDGTSIIHGLIDDFCVYGTALAEAEIAKLYTGTLPTVLPAADKLLAYWDFNDYPSEGAIASITPAANVTDAIPTLVQIVHAAGSVAWNAGNVTLKIDGTAVTPTITKVSDIETVAYVPSPIFAVQSKHTVSLSYPGIGTTKTLEWKFTVGVYTKDAVASRTGTFLGGSSYTASGGGHTGKAGDLAADFGASGTGPVYVKDATFLNPIAAGDEMTLALWIKQYNIQASSAFWAQSTSLAERGWQAHVPWSDDTIYFDTGGCCTADTQRLSANITTFDDYSAIGDDSYWTNWHFFVFSKKADVKQIWIDGKLFLEGTGAVPLRADFVDLYIVSGYGATVSRMHALIDDFTIYSTQLSEADIQSLYSGTLPPALAASKGLTAYWDFNDMPAAGIYVSVSPMPDATNAAPNLIKVVHQDGTAALDPAKAALKLDGATVAATVTKTGGLITVLYVPSPLLAAGSTHAAELLYDGQTALQWTFTVGVYTKDVLHNYVGALEGTAKFTPDAGGHTGRAGDYGIDLGASNSKQSVHAADASFLNAAAANDVVAMDGWQKLYSVSQSSLFWGSSPSSNGNSRGWNCHSPWSDGTIYFDTAGCCDGSTQRISGPITDFPGYSGDTSWWTQWHYMVYQKNLTTKEVWIDGVLFLTGESTSPLPTDFTDLYFGMDVADNVTMYGVIDDIAIFGAALDEATIGKLVAGTLPNALPASTKLLAYFDFNDSKTAAVPPTLKIERSTSGLTITFTGTLQSADAVTGSWADLPGGSPMNVPTTGSMKFYRAKK